MSNRSNNASINDPRQPWPGRYPPYASKSELIADLAAAERDRLRIGQVQARLISTDTSRWTDPVSAGGVAVDVARDNAQLQEQIRLHRAA